MENDHHAWRMAKSTTMFQVTVPRSQVASFRIHEWLRWLSAKKKDKTPVMFLGWYPLVN